MQMHSRSFIMPYIGVLGDIVLPRCPPKQIDSCFRRSCIALRVHLRNARNSGRGSRFSAPLLPWRTVRVARCNHCTWTTMHERVASCAAWPVFFISVDLLLALRQRPVPLCGPAMRRDATFATVRDSTPRHRVRYSRIRGTSCTSPRSYHHVAPACHAGGRECRVCNVAGRSYDCRPKASSCPVRALRTPFLFHSPDSRSPLASPFLSKVLPARIDGHDCRKSIFRRLRTGDPPNCTWYFETSD